MTNKIKPLTNFRNLLDVDQLNKSDINYIFEYAEKLQSIAKGSIRKIPALRGKTILNYFAEPSTRTRVSFENAGKILSADVINMSSSGSSDEKGESLFNSVQTLESIGANLLVMRHFDAGAPYFVARNIGIPVINAGDGSHAHPTQNLIDLYTVHKKVGNIEGLNLTVLGDNVHSRVARSTIIGFSIMGARITICAPTTMDAQYLSDNSSKKSEIFWPEVNYSDDLEASLKSADLVMALRTQFERKSEFVIPNINEYTRLFKLSEDSLRNVSKDIKILHPGPMNLGIEIDGYVSNSDKSLINEQVQNSVSMRMAVLLLLIGDYSLDAI